MTPRAALYARISQTDPNIDATSDQLSRCRALALSEGYEVVAEYRDDGISGWAQRARPGFLALTDDVRSGRVDVVLAVAEDRFTREAGVKIGFSAECARAKVTWHTLAGGKVDPSTAGGRLLSTLTGGIAEYESALRSERVTASVQRRLAEGKDLGGPRPFGFNRTARRGVLEINEPEAKLVRAAHLQLVDGASLYSIAKDWDKSDLRPTGKAAKWRTQTIRQLLSRPRNAGLLAVNGEIFESALQPAIVDQSLHEEVLRILNDPSRRPKRGPVPITSPATGVVRCGICGSYVQITGASTNGGRSLRCAGEGRATAPGVRHPTMSMRSLNAQLMEAAGARVLAVVHDSSLPTTLGAQATTLRQQLSRLTAQRDAQQSLIGQPGVNVDLAIRTIAGLGDDIAQAARDLENLLASDEKLEAKEMARRFVDAISPGVTISLGLSFLEEWAPMWDALGVERQRRLLRGLFESIELMPFERGWPWRLRLDGNVYRGPNLHSPVSAPF